MKKFYIKTFGCQMNVYDGQRIANMLEKSGMIVRMTISMAMVEVIKTMVLLRGSSMLKKPAL